VRIQKTAFCLDERDPVVSSEQSWTIGRLLEWTTQFLTQKGSESPRLDAQVLLAHVLHCKRIDLYTRHGEEPSADARQQFRELIRQRVEGCPVAYLVGRKEFYSLEFEVNRDVLIPRADSETAVGECLRLAKGMPEPHVLDIGTGSGNLAIAIAYHHKSSSVTAIDISPASLAVARRNAEKNGVDARVRFLEGDLFAPLSADERFDFIVSNPPYIPHADIAGLAAGVRDYEPHLALDGGPDGFVVFDRLIAGAASHLKPGGYLIVEIGSPQEAPARQRLEQHGGYELAATVRDSAGHPRVLLARLRG
jgi:release factor glutamine methyltransferase